MFKVGDKVECNIEHASYLTKGRTYEIESVYNDLVSVWADLGAKGLFHESYFKLVSNTPEVNPVTIEIPTLVVVHNRDCECGAWAVKDHLHSTWCRVYKES